MKKSMIQITKGILGIALFFIAAITPFPSLFAIPGIVLRLIVAVLGSLIVFSIMLNRK